MNRYLRKADGTWRCREDDQPVTSKGSHEAQWHSLSPRPRPDGLSGDSMTIGSYWDPPRYDDGDRRASSGPMEYY